MDRAKSHRGNASQFFVAGELCRRGYAALVTIGNTPNTDILCSNKKGTRFVHVQVKTFVPGTKSCSVGAKAEVNPGRQFFWGLAGIPEPKSTLPFEYFIVPAANIIRPAGQAPRRRSRLSSNVKRNAVRQEASSALPKRHASQHRRACRPVRSRWRKAGCVGWPGLSRNRGHRR